MKKYIAPEFEMIDVNVTDIILTSTDASYNPFDPDTSDGTIVVPGNK